MNLERPSAKSTEQKEHSNAFQEFERKINKGEEIKTTELEQSLVDGQIREDEFKVLALKLLEISAHIEEGLSGVALRLDKEKEELETERHIDSLTGLSNAVKPTLDRLIKELSLPREGEGQRPSRLAAVMVVAMDLNRFKELNDTHGHHAGDQALVLFANRVKSVTREGHDVVFRSNKKGDEFILVLPVEKDQDIDLQSLEALFLELKRKVNTDLSVDIDGINFQFSAAMGYSLATRSGREKTVEELLNKADQEMYKDKKASKK